MTYEQGVLRLSICNPLPTEQAETTVTSGHQLAVNNIRHRLQALYASAGKLSLRREGDFYFAVLQMPA